MASPFNQNEAVFLFKADALDERTFVVTSFTGEEAISRPFRYALELDADSSDVPASDVVGKKGTFTLFDRAIHGVVSEFEYNGFQAERHQYSVTLVPHLWLLTLNSDNELFLEKGAAEVIKDVIQNAGIGAKYELTGTYPTKEVFTQYQETDLAFITRLAEHYGISFRFEHSGSSDVVSFFDDSTDSPAIDGDSVLRYEPEESLLDEIPSLSRFVEHERVVTAKVIVKDHNYRTPETALISEDVVNDGMRGTHYFEYGSHHSDQRQGDDIVRVRKEEIECGRRLFRGVSDQPTLSAGYTFELQNHRREGMNGKYLVTQVSSRGMHQFGGYREGAGGATDFQNTFTCIPLGVVFRTARTTRVPKVSGVMTARTETAGGPYAHIDDQGRYRVKMPFDLSETTNGEASTWIRMSQPYSGAGYGMHFPSHADTELVWACVNGDPDRPVVLGSAPNPSNGSPVSSDNKSQNVIKTWGGHFLIFDDEKGAELIALFSTKDHTVQITHNEEIEIGNDRTIHVKRSHDETIDQHMTLSVGVNSTEDVGASKTLSVGSSYSVTVGATMNLAVGAASTESVGGAKSLTVGAGHSETIAGSKSVTVNGSSDERVNDDKSVMIAKNLDEKIDGKHTVQVTKECKVEAKKIQVIAADEIMFKTGAAQIVMKKNGNIEIKGKDITVKGSGKINVKADGVVTLKGSQIKAN